VSAVTGILVFYNAIHVSSHMWPYVQSCSNDVDTNQLKTVWFLTNYLHLISIHDIDQQVYFLILLECMMFQVEIHA
jgi:DNA/RNA-binding domain of Phe-tRNA-synthetase-like protein